MTLKDEIRNYVQEHNNVVTNVEVIEYIKTKIPIKITEECIRKTLYVVLNDNNGMLKWSGLTEEIRFYLIEKKKNQEIENITSADVVKFVHSKGYNVSEHHVRVTLSQVKKELGIKLKRKKYIRKTG